MRRSVQLGMAGVLLGALLAPWSYVGCSKDETTGQPTTTTTSSAGGGGASACPADPPAFSGGQTACSQGGLTCDYGQECCCGDCYTSYRCSCTGGVFLCYYTDACYMPGCGGGGAGGAGGAGGGGQGGT